MAKLQVDPGAEGETSIPNGAVGFQQSKFHESFQNASGRGFRALDSGDKFGKSESSFPAQTGENDEGIKGKRFATPFLLGKNHPQEIWRAKPGASLHRKKNFSNKVHDLIE